jgi:drug/metabolite transporter (DMT)-like permease
MSWVWMMTASGIGFGFTNIMMKIMATKGVGFWPTAANSLVVGIALATYAWVKTPQGLALTTLPGWLPLTLLGAASCALASGVMFMALATAPAGLGVTVVNVVGMLACVLLGAVLLAEQLTMVQWSGVALAVVGVVLMSWTK